MKKSLLTLIVLAIFLMPSITFADNIGYVDMQKIFLNYDEVKKAQKKLEKKQVALKKEVEKRQKKIKAAQDKKKSEKEIVKMIERLEEEIKPQREELVQLNMQIQEMLRHKIIKSSKSTAKEYGIDVVVDKSALLYGGFDLTDFVIEKLNK